MKKLKTELIEIALRAQRSGLCKHKTGNFSIRDKKTGLIVITPTGVDREELTPDHIPVIDEKGKIVESVLGLKPTSEGQMHLSIYRNFPKTSAIVHTHSVEATSFAILNKSIPAITYEVASLGLKEARIPVARYARPGTVELSESVIEPLKKSDVILLEKHGVVCIDEISLYDAYLKAEFVEEVATLYKNTLIINQGKEPTSISQEELDAWQYPEIFQD